MDVLSNPALIWFIAAVILLLLEFVIPGLFVVFFGFGALLTALSVFLFEPSLAGQFLIFSVTSVLSLVLLRKVLMNRLFNADQVDPDEEFVGHFGSCLEKIEPGGQGKVEFKGTNWSATSESPVEKGQKVRVTNKEGLLLIVEPAK